MIRSNLGISNQNLSYEELVSKAAANAEHPHLSAIQALEIARRDLADTLGQMSREEQHEAIRSLDRDARASLESFGVNREFAVDDGDNANNAPMAFYGEGVSSSCSSGAEDAGKQHREQSAGQEDSDDDHLRPRVLDDSFFSEPRAVAAPTGKRKKRFVSPDKERVRIIERELKRILQLEPSEERPLRGTNDVNSNGFLGDDCVDEIRKGSWATPGPWAKDEDDLHATPTPTSKGSSMSSKEPPASIFSSAENVEAGASAQVPPSPASTDVVQDFLRSPNDLQRLYRDAVCELEDDKRLELIQRKITSWLQRHGRAKSIIKMLSTVTQDPRVPKKMRKSLRKAIREAYDKVEEVEEQEAYEEGTSPGTHPQEVGVVEETPRPGRAGRRRRGEEQNVSEKTPSPRKNSKKENSSRKKSLSSKDALKLNLKKIKKGKRGGNIPKRYFGGVSGSQSEDSPTSLKPTPREHAGVFLSARGRRLAAEKVAAAAAAQQDQTPLANHPKDTFRPTSESPAFDGVAEANAHRSHSSIGRVVEGASSTRSSAFSANEMGTILASMRSAAALACVGRPFPPTISQLLVEDEKVARLAVEVYCSSSGGAPVGAPSGQHLSVKREELKASAIPSLGKIAHLAEQGLTTAATSLAKTAKLLDSEDKAVSILEDEMARLVLDSGLLPTLKSELEAKYKGIFDASGVAGPHDDVAGAHFASLVVCVLSTVGRGVFRRKRAEGAITGKLAQKFCEDESSGFNLQLIFDLDHSVFPDRVGVVDRFSRFSGGFASGGELRALLNRVKKGLVARFRSNPDRKADEELVRVRDELLPKLRELIEEVEELEREFSNEVSSTGAGDQLALQFVRQAVGLGLSQLEEELASSTMREKNPRRTADRTRTGGTSGGGDDHHAAAATYSGVHQSELRSPNFPTLEDAGKIRPSSPLKSYIDKIEKHSRSPARERLLRRRYHDRTGTVVMVQFETPKSRYVGRVRSARRLQKK